MVVGTYHAKLNIEILASNWMPLGADGVWLGARGTRYIRFKAGNTKLSRSYHAYIKGNTITK